MVGTEGGVRVADLAWAVDVTGGEETHYADSVVGRYVAWEKRGTGFVILPNAMMRREAGSTVADARAAAQDDFVARISSALVRG